MTRKRKISYSELPAPDARPPAAQPPAAIPPATAESSPARLPDERSDEPSAAQHVRTPVPERVDGAPNPRRRRADHAESPRDLATALNERLAHVRGEPPPPVPASDPRLADAPPSNDAGTGAEADTGARSRLTAERVASDTMEFAVSSAVAAIPFRERARARVGSVELLLFRVGHELFAAPLASVEEAVELPAIRHLPEMADDMLGMFALRGRMMPIYSPSRPLGVSLGAAPTAALVVRAGAQRVALAVDDVDDVLDLDLGTLRDAPGVEDADGILLGVARRGRDLVAVLDGDALVAACLTDRPVEAP